MRTASSGAVVVGIDGSEAALQAVRWCTTHPARSPWCRLTQCLLLGEQPGTDQQ